MKKLMVLDTSVVLAVVLGESQKRRLEELTQGVDLIAPLSLKWEMGNALSAMFKRKMISLRESERALNAFYEIPIQYVDIDLFNALKICHEYGIYAYDAYMIICSQKQEVPLLTLDETLKSVAQKCLVETLEV
jgi:predicted nucleic acid-binding protein